MSAHTTFWKQSPIMGGVQKGHAKEHDKLKQTEKKLLPTFTQKQTSPDHSVTVGAILSLINHPRKMCQGK
jgi:hypothetical protein